jgi:hypothetical protein
MNGINNKQPKRGRLWLADGPCIRLSPQDGNHVWSQLVYLLLSYELLLQLHSLFQ